VSVLKKRGLGVLIAVVSLIFVLSSCVLFKPWKVGKNWEGTVNISLVTPNIATGNYSADITFKFEWLLGTSKIKGGTVELTRLASQTEERATVEPYKFNITAGEYKEADSSLTFEAKEIDFHDILEFAGTVVGKTISNGTVANTTTPVGTFTISEQGS